MLSFILCKLFSDTLLSIFSNIWNVSCLMCCIYFADIRLWSSRRQGNNSHRTLRVILLKILTFSFAVKKNNKGMLWLRLIIHLKLKFNKCIFHIRMSWISRFIFVIGHKLILVYTFYSNNAMSVHIPSIRCITK